MEITIRGLSCSILEAICPNCHLSISSPFHSLMSLWSKALTWVSLLQWRGEVGLFLFFLFYFTPALSIRLLQQDHIIINNFVGMQKKKVQYWNNLFLFALVHRRGWTGQNDMSRFWGRQQLMRRSSRAKWKEGGKKGKRPLAMFSDHSHCRQKGQQIQIIRGPTGQTSGSVQNWCHVKGHEPWLEAARWKHVS